MFRKIQIAALSAFLSLGAFAAAPTAAKADGIYFSFGQGNGRAGIHMGERDRDYRPRRPHYREASCTPRRALHKAERMGLRHARITRVNHRAIRVTGRQHRDRVSVVFARAPHCPVIRIR
ncbi:hypothetical protein [Nitratireductor luteus]|uniref:hypothetical protein n=1 Tax=Nitratireductor luteus TaxID=2976980 RepID=UPI00223F09BA|nr:hypothetical protein [Nitratireductor luteus]